MAETIEGQVNLTAGSKALFESLAKDADDWGGTPIYNGDQGQNGNLTDLKVKGLVTTFQDRADTFVRFTAKGLGYMQELGIASRSLRV